jgi:hypothetical protein
MRTIYRARRRHEVTIVVDPGDCEAIVSRLPRINEREDIAVVGGPCTVSIIGREVVLICKGSARCGCRYRIVHIERI